jgi:hypothetical protein
VCGAALLLQVFLVALMTRQTMALGVIGEGGLKHARDGRVGEEKIGASAGLGVGAGKKMLYIFTLFKKVMPAGWADL